MCEFVWSVLRGHDNKVSAPTQIRSFSRVHISLNHGEIFVSIISFYFFHVPKNEELLELEGNILLICTQYLEFFFSFLQKPHSNTYSKEAKETKTKGASILVSPSYFSEYDPGRI